MQPTSSLRKRMKSGPFPIRCIVDVRHCPDGVRVQALGQEQSATDAPCEVREGWRQLVPATAVSVTRTPSVEASVDTTCHVVAVSGPRRTTFGRLDELLHRMVPPNCAVAFSNAGLRQSPRKSRLIVCDQSSSASSMVGLQAMSGGTASTVVPSGAGASVSAIEAAPVVNLSFGINSGRAPRPHDAASIENVAKMAKVRQQERIRFALKLLPSGERTVIVSIRYGV